MWLWRKWFTNNEKKHIPYIIYSIYIYIQQYILYGHMTSSKPTLFVNMTSDEVARSSPWSSLSWVWSRFSSSMSHKGLMYLPAHRLSPSQLSFKGLLKTKKWFKKLWWLWMFYGCFMDVLWMFYGCFMDVSFRPKKKKVRPPAPHQCATSLHLFHVGGLSQSLTRSGNVDFWYTNIWWTKNV